MDRWSRGLSAQYESNIGCACGGAGLDFVRSPVGGWDTPCDMDEVARYFVFARGFLIGGNSEVGVLLADEQVVA